MTTRDLARVLCAAADVAEQDLSDRERSARLDTDAYSPEEWAAYRLLRWLADGAEAVVSEDDA